MITAMTARFGKDSQPHFEAMRDPGPGGALAALETFYYAFNHRSLEALSSVWLDDPLVQLNNPLGGILRGADAIRSLYQRVLTGPARVWVEFADIVQFRLGDAIVFAGRERGEFAVGGTVVPLAIRTSRVFAFSVGTGWRQVHHHGSIDDPESLRSYQQAVRGVEPTRS